jgi:hypothetical protein
LDALEELWEKCGWREVEESRKASGSKLLTLLMGKGWAGAARWMASKGVAPASIATSMGSGRKVCMATPLAWIAARGVKADGACDAPVDAKKALECAKLAVEWGGRFEDGEEGATPMEAAFELAEVSSRAAASKFIEGLAKMAGKEVLAGLGKRVGAAALRNKGSEVWGLKLASKIGCSHAGLDGDDLAQALEWPVSRSKQQARFSGVLELLRAGGANKDLFEAGHERFRVGRRICSARASRCLDALMPDGDVDKSAAGKLVLATMDGADRNRARKGAESRMACLEWLAKRAGGFEWEYASEESPWARAAKLCLDRELALFARSGADFKCEAESLPQHALFASKAGASGPRQKDCMAILEKAGVDWSALDSRGRSVLELAAGTALDVDSLEWLAKRQLSAGGRIGDAEVKAASRRGHKMAALMESLALEDAAGQAARGPRAGVRL